MFELRLLEYEVEWLQMDGTKLSSVQKKLQYRTERNMAGMAVYFPNKEDRMSDWTDVPTVKEEK